MSAWDISGAAVWTPLAVWIWAELLFGDVRPENQAMGVVFGTALALASIFCISRLMGAKV